MNANYLSRRTRLCELKLKSFITTLLNFDQDHMAGMRTTRIPVLLALTEIAAGILYFYPMKQPRIKERRAFYLKILIIAISNYHYNYSFGNLKNNNVLFILFTRSTLRLTQILGPLLRFTSRFKVSCSDLT